MTKRARIVVAVVVLSTFLGSGVYIATRRDDTDKERLTRAEFVAIADRTCAQAEAAQSRIPLPEGDPLVVDDAQRKRWLAAFEKRSDIIDKEIRALAAIEAPKYVFQWKEAIESLGVAAKLLPGVAEAVRQKDRAMRDRRQQRISQLGEYASLIMRDAGLLVCGSGA